MDAPSHVAARIFSDILRLRRVGTIHDQHERIYRHGDHDPPFTLMSFILANDYAWRLR